MLINTQEMWISKTRKKENLSTNQIVTAYIFWTTHRNIELKSEIRIKNFYSLILLKKDT